MCVCVCVCAHAAQYVKVCLKEQLLERNRKSVCVCVCARAHIGRLTV